MSDITRAKHILLVDDEAILQDILKRMLERAHHRVALASSGEEALGVLKTCSIDLVITDLYMPSMSGLDLLVSIKENWPKMPVIIMSGRGPEARNSAVAAGADDFIAKPFRSAEVLERVTSFTSQAVARTR